MCPNSKGIRMMVQLMIFFMFLTFAASFDPECECLDIFDCDCEEQLEPILVRHKRQGYFCSEFGLEALSIPPFLMVPTPFQLNEDNTGTYLRCTEGKILNMPPGTSGFVSGGYFKINCTDGAWQPPATGAWPNVTDCSHDGNNCTVNPRPADWPTYLVAVQNVTMVRSGESIDMDCSDPNRTLIEPFSMECYDGSFVDTPFPDYDSCVTPHSCSVSQLDTIVPGPPSYLTVIPGSPTVIPDNGFLFFTCANNKNFTWDEQTPAPINKINITCSNGQLFPPFSWPPYEACQMFCTSAPVPPTKSVANTTLPVIEGDEYFFDCKTEGDVFDTNYMDTRINVTCLGNGSFSSIFPWPSCVPTPSCGTPPGVFTGSGLQLMNDPTLPVYAGDSAFYNCTNPNFITDLGQYVEIICTPVKGNASFTIPATWDSSGTTCRAPVNCTVDPPPAPNGLTLKPPGPPGYYVELSVANYVCTNATSVFYKMGSKLNQTSFDLTCQVGGFFPDVLDWPKCEDPNPPNCTNYPPPPPGVPIEILNKVPQSPGGYVSYVCSDRSKVSTLGDEIKVYCVKDTATNASFVTPIGWAQSRCTPKKYPEFSIDEGCYCLGDSRLTKAQAKLILDNACRPYFFNYWMNNIATPLKQRCGVTDPDNPTKKNLCTCTETNDNAADFGIWSFAHIRSQRWKITLSDPSLQDFRMLEIEFEKQIDERILDYWKVPGWMFVRTKVLMFLPGQPQACSSHALPEPDDASGLEILTKTKVEFGDYGEYICKNRSLVTNDGITFKLLCSNTGQFYRRPWGTCREKKVCTMPPPIPIFSTGLWLSNSTNVTEFDFATYNCTDPNEYIPNTPDGVFKIPCQRSGRFQQIPTTTLTWPNCVPKPTTICENIPEIPVGYVQLSDEVPFLKVGDVWEIGCENPDLLAGNQTSLTFKCGIDPATNKTGFLGYSNSSVPKCRAKKECFKSRLPIPSDESGISQPYITDPIMELDYVDYNCFEKGIEWQLFGDYTTKEFSATNNIEVVDGNLRIHCMIGGISGTVTNWPACRDTTVTSCDPKELTLAGTGLVPSTTVPVSIGSKITIFCSTAGYTTDKFNQLTLTCLYDGNFDLPDILSPCRPAKVCPAPPALPSDSKLKLIPSASPIKEYDIQTYNCQTNFTLYGVIHPLVSGGLVKLPCIINSTGWDPPPSWPDCVPVIGSCDTFNISVDMPNFKYIDSLPMAVGGQMRTQCTKPGYVTSVGKIINVICTESGKFQVPNPVPPCRPPVPCDPNPIPPSSARLQNSTSQNVTEWGTVYYSCVNGSSFNTSTVGSLVNGKFPLLCGLLGKFEDPPPWGGCYISHCLNLPAPFGYNTTGVSPVPVNVSINYTCANPGWVPGNSDQPVVVTCLPNGTFENIVWPTCRARVPCRAAPTPNITTSFLLATTSTGIMEFEYANFSCKPGANLNNVTFPGVRNGLFYLQCPLGGTFPPTFNVSWPTCNVESCNVYLVKTGFISYTPLPVAMNGTASYQCSTPGFITNNGSSIPLTCGSSGSFIAPSPWPTCRAPTKCPSPPGPPAYSNLAGSSSVSVGEYGFANYSCRGDGTYTNSKGNVTNSFSVLCRLGGTYDPAPLWPTCSVSNCLVVPSLIGLTADKAAPIPVGTSVTYNCSLAGQIVTNIGKSFKVMCNPNGTMNLPSSSISCKAAKTCTSIPTPTAASNLAPSTSSGILEYDFAIYTCKSGFSLDGVTTSGVLNNTFQAQCPAGGGVLKVTTWPTCLYTSCAAVPTITGMITTAVAPVAASANITYTCPTGQVSNYGTNYTATCSPATGTIPISTSPAPICTAPLTCTTPPTPPAASQLQASASTNVLENAYATYTCKTGYTLQHITNRTDIVSDQFSLLCQSGATYPVSPSWPTCLLICKTLPPTAPADVTPSVATPSIIPGQYLQYTCTNTSMIFNTSRVLNLVCGTDGTFTAPTTWPTCRLPANCTPPVPPTSTNLQLAPSSPSVVYEFTTVSFTCKTGFQLTGATNFTVSCPYGGGSITVSLWPNCTATTGRKKRLVTYNNIFPDIKYSVYVLFETQFMYTKGIEKDVIANKNITVGNPGFTKTIIDLFHARIQSVLQQGQLWRMTVDFPITPLCEQPMNPSIPIANCFKSNLQATCPTGTFLATWLETQGFRLRRQLPNYLTPRDAAQSLVPVGGGVAYFCDDRLQRPKNDGNDGDQFDGIIFTHCSHYGVMNISMNPTTWDRCRRLCPVEKPAPPVAPGAQLRIDWADKNDYKITHQLWEGETITYSCENISLVLDHTKDAFSRIYTCQADGTYSTPVAGNGGASWPQCTTQPVDPIIIQAVVLLTGVFDQNVVYRHDSTSAEGKGEVLDSQYALINITLPAILGILCFTFFIMCCTRAKSPICKIFEPQA